MLEEANDNSIGNINGAIGNKYTLEMLQGPWTFRVSS